MAIISIIANIQNICNLIGQEGYYIGRIVLSISVLHSFTKKKTTFNFRGVEDIN